MRRLARWLGWLIASLATLLAAFLLFAWIGSSIPRNGDWSQTETGIEIFTESPKGLHKPPY